MNICTAFVFSIVIFCDLLVPNLAKYSKESYTEVVLQNELQGIVFIAKYSPLLKSYNTICSANVVLDNQSVLVSPECRRKYKNYKEIFVTLTSNNSGRRHRVHAEWTYYKLGDDVYNNFTILKLRSPLNNVHPAVLPEPGKKYSDAKLKTFREILTNDAKENSSMIEVILTEIIDAEKCMEIFANAGLELQLDGKNSICSFTPKNNSRLGNMLGGAYCDKGPNFETSILCFSNYPIKDYGKNLPEIYHNLLPIAFWIKQGQNSSGTDYITFKNILVFYVTVLVAVLSLMCIGYGFWKKTGYRQLVTQYSTYP